MRLAIFSLDIHTFCFMISSSFFYFQLQTLLSQTLPQVVWVFLRSSIALLASPQSSTCFSERGKEFIGIIEGGRKLWLADALFWGTQAILGIKTFSSSWFVDWSGGWRNALVLSFTKDFLREIGAKNGESYNWKLRFEIWRNEAILGATIYRQTTFGPIVSI